MIGRYPLHDIINPQTGEVIVDTTSKANGRGAYLKLDSEIIAKAKKTKILDRHLEIEVPDSIYEELNSLIK